MPRKGENIYKRKDGRYEGRYVKKYNENNKPVYASVYGKTYTEVKNKLIACKTEKSCESCEMTLAEWLEKWLDMMNNIKPLTKASYKNNVYNHIIPELGSLPLQKINSSVIQKFINKKSMSLSSASVAQLYSVLRNAMKSAVDSGFANRMWCNVRLPKKEKSSVRILNPDEQQRLNITLTESEDIGILLSLYMGLRIGEVCALKWSNINFEKNTLKIEGTQIRTENGIEIVKPKTENSMRELPIPNFLINKLKSMQHSCKFVLSKKSKAVETRTYRRYFKKKLEEAKITDIAYHSLRHPYVKL